MVYQFALIVFKINSSAFGVFGKIKLASSNLSDVWEFSTPIANNPAFLAEVIPAGESSRAKQKEGLIPNKVAAV